MISKLNLEDFNKTKEKCSRWNQRSLDVIQDLLVNGLTPVDISKKYGMSKQQINMLKRRFSNKHVSLTIESYVSRVAPQKPKFNIKNHKNEIIELSNLGYTEYQIVDYFSENGFTVSEKVIQQFLETLKNENTDAG